MLTFLILFAVPPTDHLLPLDAHVVGIVAQTAAIKPVQVVEKAVEKVTKPIQKVIEKLPEPPKRGEPHQLENKRSQVLVFGASWCDACCKFDKALLADAGELTRGKDGDFILLDYENRKQFQGFLDWKVEKLPTFVIIEINERGKTKEVARVVGYPNDEFKDIPGFKAWLKRCASAEWKHGETAAANHSETPNSSLSVVDVPEVVKPKDGSFLQGVYARCPQAGLAYYTDSKDGVTNCHEATHFLNATLSNQHGKQAFYIGDGRAVLIEKPEVLLRQIAERIPMVERGELYATYFVRAGKSNDRWGLYLFDELNAYLAGCEHAKETGNAERLADSAKSAETMLKYCEATIEVIRAKQPRYNVAPLVEHLANETKRLEAFQQ